MRGDQVVGKHGGVAITRDEQRAKAAAAAEARAQSNATRGQQGSVSKIKQPRQEGCGWTGCALRWAERSPRLGLRRSTGLVQLV